QYPDASAAAPDRSAGLFQRLDANVPKRNRAVVPLQHERARLVPVLVQAAGGGTADFHLVVHFDAIEDHREAVALQARFHFLPLTRFARSKYRNRLDAVNGAVATLGRFA